MHDAAVAYDPDTFVIDVDDIEEPVMHVLLMGERHRRMPDLSRTSCDVPYHSQFAPLKPEALVGKLCGVCFTPRELLEAAKNNAKEIPEP